MTTLEKSSLSVIPVNSDQRAEFAKTVSCWKNRAQEYEQIAKCRKLSEVDRFTASRTVAERIQSCLEDYWDQYNNDYFACFDQEHRLQGLMILSKKACYENFLRIEWLMTNPSNISSELTQTASRVRGVGKRLLTEAEKICGDKKLNGLLVEPKCSSFFFYEGVGFRFYTNDAIDDDSHFMVKRLSLP